MNIIEVITKVDLELLKEQAGLVESHITQLESDYNYAVTDEVAERVTYDIDLCKGLLELLDNIICALEDL